MSFAATSGVRARPRIRPTAGALIGVSVLMSTAMIGLGAVALTPATAQAATTASAPSIGPPSATPPVTNYSLKCTALGAIPLSIGVSAFAQAPGSVRAGHPLSLHAVRTQVTIPPTFVDLARSAGVTSLSGTLDTLNFNATNAAPATLNAAATPIDFGPVPLTEGQPATLTIPRTPENVGPWTAGSGGTIAFTPGATDMVVHVLGLSAPISCAPAAPVPTLATTVIR